jgi:ADP-heptose:LPS heptosyltransferase
MIINIVPGTFGGPLRNGDMIGLLNVVEHLRKQDPNIKLHMSENTISNADYCKKMFQFLVDKTDYFSLKPGENELSWRKVNLWDFRDISGDIGVIKNTETTTKKIVVFPLFDAPYNTYRNWSPQIFKSIVSIIDNNEKYNDYEKVMCHVTPLNVTGWKDSTDFIQNLYHIMSAEVFIGAETGSSVFASALDKPPKDMIYYYSSRGLVHTLPFNVLRGKGELRTYWGNFEGTTWQ